MARHNPYIKDIRRQVGANLRRLRSDLGLSQSQVAELADLNRSYLSMVENGRRNISLDNLVALALALEVEPVVLLTMVDSPQVASAE